MAVGLGCSDKGELGPEPLPRPVSAMVLQTLDPSLEYRMTGCVESWKQEDVGFEVAGRIVMVVERGTDVLPKDVADEKDAEHAALLARLDPEQYESRVQSAEKKKEATVAQAVAQKADIDHVLKEQVRAAEANHRLAMADLGRMKQLVQKGVNSQADLEQAQATADVSAAVVDQLKAQRVAKTAKWEATKAQVAVDEQAVKDAERDLRNCTLHAPFHAEVAEVHVIPGAYVQPGSPVVTLIMMDPLKVELAVSPALERTIKQGDRVRVYAPGVDEPVSALVYWKSTVADRDTRTFKVTLIVRNRRIPTGLPEREGLRELPRVRGMLSVQRLDLEKPDAPLFVSELALVEQCGQHFVWKVVARGERAKGEEGLLTLKRVPVTVGKRRVQLLNLFTIQEIAPHPELPEGTDVAINVPSDLGEDAKVMFIPDRWLFRPGDIVSALVDDPGGQPGMYVPMNAVRPADSGIGHVFVVEDGKARRTAVLLLDTVDDRVRIEPADEAGARVREGARVVSSKIHFLVDGEKVNVVETEGASE